MFDIQVISNRPDYLARLLSSWEDTGLSDSTTMTVVAQAGSIPVCSNFYHPHFSFVESRQHKKPRLLHLRAVAYRASRELGRTGFWGVFDDDHCFLDGAPGRLHEYLGHMETIERETGRWPYLNMTGHIGATKQNQSPIVPPYCLMGTSHGLIFHPSIIIPDQDYSNLKGGGEDKVLCGFAIATGNAIPLRVWAAPVKRFERSTVSRSSSYIHQMAVWQRNTFPLIRQMSGDEDWPYVDLRPSRSPGAGNQRDPKRWREWARLWSRLTGKGSHITAHASDRVRYETGL